MSPFRFRFTAGPSHCALFSIARFKKNQRGRKKLTTPGAGRDFRVRGTGPAASSTCSNCPAVPSRVLSLLLVLSAPGAARAADDSDSPTRTLSASGGARPMRRLSRVTGTPGSRVAGDRLSRYPHGSVTVVPGALGSRVTVAVADRHAGGDRDTQPRSGLGHGQA